MTRSIPERWLAYKPHGAVIEGTNILPFKVPLKEAIARNLPPSQQQAVQATDYHVRRFTPAQLMKEFPKLKFIVDLTNTNRYYSSEDFRKAGVHYTKIMIPGKIVPPIEGVKQWARTGFRDGPILCQFSVESGTVMGQYYFSFVGLYDGPNIGLIVTLGNSWQPLHGVVDERCTMRYWKEKKIDMILIYGESRQCLREAVQLYEYLFPDSSIKDVCDKDSDLRKLFEIKDRTAIIDLRNNGGKKAKIMKFSGIEYRFCKVMNSFKSAAINGDLIGVHCTHGINRTGYLICRYLVQQHSWEPGKSLKAFEKARGYPIERAAYVTDLMNVPRQKLDTSGVDFKHSLKRNQAMLGPMGASKFDYRQRFANGRPYPPPPHQPYGYGGPPPPRAFGLRPPTLPPPLPGRWLDGPRPLAYGMLPPRPPGPGPFPGPRFAPRMSGPPGRPGPPRLPPPNRGPPPRLPVQRMPPPRLPPPRLPPPGMGSPRIPPPGMGPPRLPVPRMALPHMPPPRLSNVRISMEHLKPEVSFGPSKIADTSAALRGTVRANPATRITNDLDFTVDTFDENLTSTIRP